MTTTEQAQRIEASGYSSHAYHLAAVENGTAEPQNDDERNLRDAAEAFNRGEITNESLELIRATVWPN